MSNDILLRLSRADAMRLRGGVCACHSVYEDEPITRLLGLIDAALNAAPAEGHEREDLHIRIEKDDMIPAFAAFAHHPEQGDDRLVLLNVFASFAAARDADMSVKEILVGSLMHEFGHILEEWFGLEFSEARIEAIVQSYQQANWGYAAPAEEFSDELVDCLIESVIAAYEPDGTLPEQAARMNVRYALAKKLGTRDTAPAEGPEQAAAGENSDDRRNAMLTPENEPISTQGFWNGDERLPDSDVLPLGVSRAGCHFIANQLRNMADEWERTKSADMAAKCRFYADFFLRAAGEERA